MGGVVVKLGLCTSAQGQRNTELLKGYAEKSPLSENNVLIRRGRIDQSLQRAQKRWLKTMIVSGCYRDQLAFNFAMEKEKCRYLVLQPYARERRPFCCTGKHKDPLHVRSAR